MKRAVKAVLVVLICVTFFAGCVTVKGHPTKQKSDALHEELKNEKME